MHLVCTLLKEELLSESPPFTVILPRPSPRDDGFQVPLVGVQRPASAAPQSESDLNCSFGYLAILVLISISLEATCNDAVSRRRHAPTNLSKMRSQNYRCFTRDFLRMSSSSEDLQGAVRCAKRKAPNSYRSEDTWNDTGYQYAVDDALFFLSGGSFSTPVCGSSF